MALPMLTVPSPETLAYLSALADDEAAYQRDILQARQYYDGQQFVALTDRLREFLGGNVATTTEDWKRLRLNLVRVVVTAVVERLLITGFDTSEAGDATPVAAWAWETWQANRMDAKQRRVHEAVIRDGEAFVFVDWDAATNRPRFTPHVRYLDGSIGGDGQGCKAFFVNDDSDQDLLYVTKRWAEAYSVGSTRRTRQRLTVYYPERIEKYAGFPGAWRPTVDQDDEPWPLPWLDARRRPLGIPIAYVRSSAGPEAREAIGPQNALNKTVIDLMAAADMTAFRILIALGWDPVDADGNALDIAPGHWLGTTNPDGKVHVVDPADLSGLTNLVDKWLFWTAMATDTPVSRFITTAQVASADTQKQQDGPLINKVRSRQGEIGNGWEDAMSIARRLENTFGRGGLNEDVPIFARWAPAEVRDEDAELARAERKQKLGVPLRQLWRELGYDEMQIAEWEAERQARQAQMTRQVQGGQDEAQVEEEEA